MYSADTTDTPSSQVELDKKGHRATSTFCIDACKNRRANLEKIFEVILLDPHIFTTRDYLFPAQHVYLLFSKEKQRKRGNVDDVESSSPSPNKPISVINTQKLSAQGEPSWKMSREGDFAPSH